MTEKQRRRLHQLIADFADYSVDSISPRIESTQTIFRCFPHDVTNPVLLFLFHNAMLGVLESLLTKLTQSTDLLHKAIRDVGGGGLQRTKVVKDVQRMRNTLLAHRMEVLISSEKDMDWYTKEYGSMEKAFAAIAVANEQLCEQAYQLIEDPKFLGMQVGGMEDSSISEEQVGKLMDALKAAKIY